MPKPTPWTASRTPNQSHNETLIQGPAPPAHGTYKATEDTAQSICAKASQQTETQGGNVTYLTPTRSADTNREDRKEPRMNFAEPGKEREDGGPNANKEDTDKDEDFPVLEFVFPQEGPVLSVGLGRGR